jgi:predicted phage replisome organizer
MAEVKWIKIVTDIFDDEKIVLIESLPEADKIIVIWFKLLCMAGKQNNGGVFMLNERIAFTDEMLATIFRRPLNVVRLALSTFEKFGMIEIVNDVITIPNWEKHQSLDKIEQAKEKNRKRVAAFREKQRQLTECNDYSNDCVTQCNDIDKNRIEEDKNKNKKENKSVKENTHTLFKRLLQDYCISENVAEKVGEWIKYKTERRETYKEQGMKSLLRQIENNCFKYGDNAVINLIDECMANGWKGIIFDRLQNQNKQSSNGYKRQTKADELSEFYAIAANWAEGSENE